MDEKIPYICLDINRVWEGTIDYVELAKRVRDKMLYRINIMENGAEKRVYAVGYGVDFSDMERKLFYFEKDGLPGIWKLKSRKV
mgnify:CR=1 FL=1